MCSAFLLVREVFLGENFFRKKFGVPGGNLRRPPFKKRSDDKKLQSLCKFEGFTLFIRRIKSRILQTIEL